MNNLAFSLQHFMGEDEREFREGRPARDPLVRRVYVSVSHLGVELKL